MLSFCHPLLSLEYDLIFRCLSSLFSFFYSTFKSVQNKNGLFVDPNYNAKINWDRVKRDVSVSTQRLQGNVCNKVSVTASSSFSFASFKNRDAINASAQVFTC